MAAPIRALAADSQVCFPGMGHKIGGRHRGDRKATPQSTCKSIHCEDPPMARGVNKVILIGNLGQDPETKYMPSGSAVTNLRIATSEVFKDRETGQQQERTEWHSVAMFGRLAEIAGEYLRKGSQVYIEGRLRTRKWQDKQGQDRYTTEIVADQMQMLGGKGGGMGGGDSDAAPRERPAARPQAAEPVAELDDDIPF